MQAVRRRVIGKLAHHYMGEHGCDGVAAFDHLRGARCRAHAVLAPAAGVLLELIDMLVEVGRHVLELAREVGS
jgi:hypothetical protein